MCFKNDAILHSFTNIAVATTYYEKFRHCPKAIFLELESNSLCTDATLPHIKTLPHIFQTFEDFLTFK